MLYEANIQETSEIRFYLRYWSADYDAIVMTCLIIDGDSAASLHHHICNTQTVSKR